MIELTEADSGNWIGVVRCGIGAMAIVFDGPAARDHGAFEIVVGGSTPIRAAFFNAVADVGVSGSIPNHRFEE